MCSAMLMVAVSAFAQAPAAPPLQTAAAAAETPAALKAPSRVRQMVVFLAGAAAGLGVHEAGHVMASAAAGANPRAVRIDYGPIPFFAIRHDPVSRRQEYAISASGFWMQYAGSEWLLSTRPNLRREEAPFYKGALAFHVGVSTMYTVAAFGRLGPTERDTRGLAISLGPDGVPEPVVGVLLFAPAALDAYRYFRPDSAWARWASRGAKVLVVALAAR
jgi:hypothetical protein